MEMNFTNPLAFLLLAFLPFFLSNSLLRKIIGKFINKEKKTSEKGILFSSPIPPEEFTQTSSGLVREIILSSLRILAVTSLIIAFARPQFGTTFKETEASGRDIILALDISGSMNAIDFKLNGKRVTRLAALKHVVTQFITERPGDRIGLVVFGDQAFTQCPLTTDHSVLIEFLDYIEVGMAGNATAVGDAMAISLKRARDIEADSKVIILVTDGKSNSGSVTPVEGAKAAKKLGVKIHTIGVGQTGRAPFQVKNRFGYNSTIHQYLEYDEKTLKEIASITNGKYFNAKNIDQLQSVYDEINKLEERKDKSYQYTTWEEQFMKFIIFALFSIVFHQLLTASLLLKIP